MLVRQKVFLALALEKNLTTNDKKLVFVLMAYANKSYKINISFKEIADELNIHISTAKKCIQRLINNKIILKIKPNEYKLNPFYAWGKSPSQEVYNEFNL